MSTSDIVLENADGYGVFTMNRPDKFNAVTVETLYEGFEEAFDKIRKDESIRAVIITGAGRAFCSGFDVTSFEALENPATQSEFFEVYGDFALRVRNLQKPLIAAINGAAAAFGLSIALLCDIRLASKNAKFTCVWVKRGLAPDGGATYFLPRIVGFPIALELMLTGKVIDAAEALRIGLVNKVVPADSLMNEARDLARTLAEGPPLAIGLTRQAAYAGLSNDLEQQLLYETTVQRRLFQTLDCKEATAAFLEKRRPLFKGK